MGPRGEVWRELDEGAVGALIDKLRALNVEALAICLIHSYVDSTHERRIAELIKDSLGDDLYVTCSSEILPEISEYDRTSTTVVNAYIGPSVAKYIASLVERLAKHGVVAPLEIIQSNGGAMTAAAAVRKPASIVESGPAAGVIAAARLAKLVDNKNAISFDMGGTTTKVAMIENGEPVKTTEYEVGAGINHSSMLVKGGGYPIKLPFIDVSEIGAGGGSIIVVNELRSVKVGPQSAGSMPGPVCYDLGGEEATLTDAFVVLGYLNPNYLVGGSLILNAEKSRIAIDEQVAKPLQKSLLEAAYGVLEIAISNMARAVKAVTTYRGRDPRDFTLIAFGGNGPVMAVSLARAFEMQRVLIPAAPGVFSALGLYFSDTEHEFSRSYFADVNTTSSDVLGQVFASVEGDALEALAEEGYQADRVKLSRFVNMRYSGQAYELVIPVLDKILRVDDLAHRFHEEHKRTYGHSSKTDPVSLVSIKVIARGMTTAPKTYDPMHLIRSDKGDRGLREAYFGSRYENLQTDVIRRKDLINKKIEGPLIIEEYDATCVIPPECIVCLDEFGNIDITLEDVK